MTDDAATVSFDAVRKEYGDTVALDGVDLAVEPGEFFTLVGPSGCGKTTTLRTLAGFESPTSGTVRIDGTDVTGVPPEERDIGVVFQNYALFPHMTVGENVGYGLRFAAPPGDVSRDERVRELLALVDLEGFADREPDTLSGGQRQRVALARALAPGPRLLLLDEPMSALDARLRERLRTTVRGIQRELGITTVYVTHDQAEALAISDRVAVVNDGGVEQVGTPRAVYRRPATRFVAEFVGDNNVFTGEVVATGAHADERVNDVRATDERVSDERDGDPTTDTLAAATDATAATVAVGERRLTVAVPGDDPVRVGDRLTLCVRPGALARDATTNRLQTTVAEAEFLGETTRVRCDWNDRTLTLRLADPPAVGERVTVGFAPAAAHVVAVGRPG
ncbi:ABC transporter ATP-binding protein [Halobaculum sp. MBLA0147]|uniref:ABC transporter ATP-binding protein n=1 Tax=Halobaculum sp. MBLA0147 TaxID=3079934 RepID=UPI0035267B91